MLSQRLSRLVFNQSLIMSRMKSTSTSATQTPMKKQNAVIDPLKSRDYFGVYKLFTIKDLFDARVHLGHATG